MSGISEDCSSSLLKSILDHPTFSLGINGSCSSAFTTLSSPSYAHLAKIATPSRNPGPGRAKKRLPSDAYILLFLKARSGSSFFIDALASASFLLRSNPQHPIIITSGSLSYICSQVSCIDLRVFLALGSADLVAL